MPDELIAITGAGGFIGQALLARLRAEGRNAVGILRGETPGWDGEAWRADLTQPRHLASLSLRPAIIVHLAGAIDIALQAHPRWRCAPAQPSFAALYEGNVAATARMAEFALRAGTRRIVFASSQAVYGFGEAGVADEETPLRPLEHYAASKVAAEQLLEMASRQGLAVTILRFPGIFAPKRTSGAVWAMCRAAVRQRAILVRAEVPLPFDVLGLPDVVEGLTRAVATAGEPLEKLNLATGRPNSLSLLARQIAALVPGATVTEEGPPQPEICLRVERAAARLGWRAESPEVRLREMLESFPS